VRRGGLHIAFFANNGIRLNRVNRAKVSAQVFMFS
jgi:hypothetical protein